MTYPANTDDCSLGDMDWKVIDIARRDAPPIMNPKGLLSRTIRAIFGLSGARGLANERLETLRSFCVRAWRSDWIRTKDMRPVLDAGYSAADISRIIAHIARHRGFFPWVESSGN